MPPGSLDEGRVVRQTGTHNGRMVERVSRYEIDGRISRLLFEYRIETADGARHATEIHQLGLFTVEEMAAAFKRAGFRAEFDGNGLTGRGLWLADPRPDRRVTFDSDLTSAGKEELPCPSTKKAPFASTMRRPVPASRCCSSPAGD